ncbi:RIP metalloprotease RseP [Paraclostridium ghonii]|uniref:Zinc metalloprotease n=1 Tax=Paraclostridium ghonii TaxID=29358 RepID=A0ABU0MWN2_9FIRM|nr:RIP metalloprotease RseP [Paeniclostridium ghonii]MDQ0555318.1 regulator of sigma E protease [Paeniclostridium ghonii]
MNIITILVAILAFGIIVFIHELGHFLFAKKAGVKIHEFAIGMGPKIYSFKKGETVYSIRILPLGGYIAMEGEDADSNDPRAFGNKSILQRASILFAGPFFNIILATIILAGIYMYQGVQSTTLKEVIDGSVAQQAGIQAGDTITEINGNDIKDWNELTKSIQDSKGNELKIGIERNGEEKEVKVTPEEKKGNYLIGIYPEYKKDIFGAFGNAIKVTIAMLGQIIAFFGKLITGNLPGGLEGSVAGPIGVISIVADATKVGIINVLFLAAVISLNLGVLNLLPIPALDGGRLFFLFIEFLRGGKKIDPEKEGMVNLIGFATLMVFMLFITYKDIVRLVGM